MTVNLEAYNKIVDKLQEKIDNNEMTESVAEMVNVAAFRKYVDPTFVLEDAIVSEADTAAQALGTPAPAVQTIPVQQPMPAPAQAPVVQTSQKQTLQPNLVNKTGKTISNNLTNKANKAATAFVKNNVSTPQPVNNTQPADVPANGAKQVAAANAEKSRQLNELQKDYEAKKKEIKDQTPVSNS